MSLLVTTDIGYRLHLLSQNTYYCTQDSIGYCKSVSSVYVLPVIGVGTGGGGGGGGYSPQSAHAH